MSNKFLPLSDKAQLENLLEASKQKPILIFKHSTACALSFRAYREMEKLQEVNLLEIQRSRALSSEVATITGVCHESPQVIVLRNGKAVWDASHFDVNAQAVTEAIDANS